MSSTVKSIAVDHGKAETSFSFAVLIADFMLVNIAFLSICLIDRETFSSVQANTNLMSLLYATWLASSILTQKFRPRSYASYFNGVVTFVKSNALLLYGVLCLIFVFGIKQYLSLHVFEMLAALFVLEVVLFSEYYLRAGHGFRSQRRHLPGVAVSGVSVFLVTADLTLFAAAFWCANWFLLGSSHLDPGGVNLLLILYAFWVTTSQLTRKYEHRCFRKLVHLFAPNIKATLLTALGSFAVIALLRLSQASFAQVACTLAFSMVLGVAPNALYSVVRLRRKWERHDIESAAEVRMLLQQEDLDIAPSEAAREDEPAVEPALREGFLRSFPTLYRLISQTIDLSRVPLRRAEVLYCNTDIRDLALRDSRLKLLVNVDRVNDIRSLNRYFLDVHRKLANGGIFVCKAETIDSHKTRFMTRFPGGFGQVLYLFDFVYRRVLPRLPGLKLLYFAVSRGRNRVLSRAEFLGRLYFCGFRVLTGATINGHYYAVAQKAKTPSRDSNPSNDLLLQLKRIGYRGEIIYLNKFRTMFPYSEYLQEYIYQRNRLQPNGKFKSDFRITEWGKVFRKFWIDELPQFINYFRGELNIVGVRALSKQYFDLYPADLQELRLRFKPGLIPPYYHDLPQSFEEIVESERRYLEQKQQRPLWTDIKYLTSALYNIFLRGARSK